MFAFQSHSPTIPGLAGTALMEKRKAGVGCIAAMILALAVGTPAAAQTTQNTEQWVPGRLLVQPRPGLSDDELAKILKAHGGKSVGRIPRINVHIVQLPPNASEKAIAALIAKNPHIKFAERDMIVKPEGTANDLYYSSAWHLAKIGVSAAWDSSSGQGITVAILDSGVDGNHPDLAANMVPGWNVYSNNSDTSDVYGHGTKVAGTVAAATNNSIGVAAVAGAARLMPLRISATDGGATYSAMATALAWAADHGAKVANISYQSVSGSATVQNAAQYLKNLGGVTVVASGNTGVEQSFTPSNTMISVAATDSNDARASWSSYGNYVDIAAPGVGIWTTASGGGYGAVSGTSFASPVTAGVVALMKAANPSLGPDDIQNLLFSTAKDLGTAGWDKYYGYGRVEAAAAVLASKSAVISDTAAPTVSLTAPTGGATVKGLVAVNVSANDNIGVSRVELVVNGTKLASDTASPYGFTWDSSMVPDGSATLIAYAYDAAGNYSSSTVSVKVANTTDTTAPTAAISNPGSGTKVSGNVSVAASASDNIAVTSVKLYINNQLKASISGGSLSYNWNTRKLPAGTHTIQVDAMDAAGNVGSQSIQVVK